jgi:hypothetical protein
MEIYGRDKAERVFKSQKIPVNSLGIFKANDREWVYWFSDSLIYDTGSANSEAAALQKAKRNIELINIRYENENIDVEWLIKKFSGL